jgi:DNA-binding transcriptional ArsR family regulator
MRRIPPAHCGRSASVRSHPIKKNPPGWSFCALQGALTARAKVSQPAVSKHLGVLKQAGLVRDRHEGRQTHYSAQLGALAPLIDWTSQMAGFWQGRFDQLEDLLKRMDQ